MLSPGPENGDKANNVKIYTKSESELRRKTTNKIKTFCDGGRLLNDIMRIKHLLQGHDIQCSVNVGNY